MGTGCEYHLAFASGKLITPNPLNGTPPTKIRFKRSGQSIELMWDNTLTSWILTGGNGAYIS
jgi:hypothetical protein